MPKKAESAELTKKNADFFVYVKKKLYLCSRKGFRTMNDYRFINIDEEPTEEQLAQLMREVAEEAKERYEIARAAYFAKIDQMMCAL
jgi:Ser-tRNA(Ala) deacylase AlaX